MSYNSKYTGLEVENAVDKMAKLNIVIVDAGEEVEEPELDYVTRKVKDAKDFETGELIYLKGHAKATYMSDGRTVEDAVNDINTGGGGSSSGGSGAYAEVNHGTSDTTFVLTPNTFHVWGEVTELDLTLGEELSGIANEYLFQFTSGDTPSTVILPETIKWMTGDSISIESNKIYQISILRGLASVLAFDLDVSVFPVVLTYESQDYTLGRKVYLELEKIAGTGVGELPEGNLAFVLRDVAHPVTYYFFEYVLDSLKGYVLWDTGMEYYILESSGVIQYFFYD